MSRGGLNFRRALVTGAVLAAIAVAAAAIVAYYAGTFERTTVSAEDVIVVLVLPDEEGVAIPRIITRVANGTAMQIDPLTTVRIAGTSFDTLRDAYPFGGGEGLASSIVEAAGTTDQATAAGLGGGTPAYIIVGSEIWAQLAAQRPEPVSVDIPEHMEVFDGERLYTFPEGLRDVAATDMTALFNGAEYVSDTSRESLRTQVAEELVRRLAAQPQTLPGVTTNLSAAELEAWRENLYTIAP